jgi:transcriptional regulator with XRE-family HTH domain
MQDILPTMTIGVARFEQTPDLSRMLTGLQIRLGRTALGITGANLARRAGVSYATLMRAEAADGVPNIKAQNLHAIERVLLDAGVVLEGETGVRLRRPAPG